jgi:hypothetical protein
MKHDKLVFISHASEDKPFVKSLADRLRIEGVNIWYDEYSLKLGDSLREKIDDGLKKCQYGLVVLSPDFFIKKWTRKELDGLASKEIIGTNVILPIWHNVGFNEVFAFSPLLADRIAVKSTLPLETILSRILDSIDFKIKDAEHTYSEKSWEEEVQDLASVYTQIKKVIILSELYNDKISITPMFEINSAFDHIMQAFEKKERKSNEFIEAKEHLFRAAKDCYEIIILNRIGFINNILKNYKLTNVSKILPEYFQSTRNIIYSVNTKLMDLRAKSQNEISFIKEYEDIYLEVSVIAEKINSSIPELEIYENKKPRSFYEVIFNKRF